MVRSISSGYAIRRGDHVGVPYGTDSDRHGLLATHLTTALECGERFVYVAENGSWETASENLPLDPLECETLLMRGQLVIRPDLHGWGIAGVLTEVGDLIDMIRLDAADAISAGYLGLRVWVDSTVTVDPVFERLLSSELADRGLAEVALICGFDERRLSAEQLSALRRAHPITLSADAAQRREPMLQAIPLPDRPGLRLVGEIDRTNHDEFAELLDQVRREEHDLHLEVAGLRYADVSAVRLLAQIADAFANGNRLVLHDPPLLIRTTLRIYGWDLIPSLLIKEGRPS